MQADSKNLRAAKKVPEEEEAPEVQYLEQIELESLSETARIVLVLTARQAQHVQKLLDAEDSHRAKQRQAHRQQNRVKKVVSSRIKPKERLRVIDIRDEPLAVV